MDWDISSTGENNGTYHARAYRTGAGSSWAYARLLTNAMDLSAYDVAQLRFSHRKQGSSSQLIRAYQNSTGNPADWVLLFSESASSSHSTYSRPAVRLDLTNLTANVQLRFDVYTFNAGDTWYIDDVQLSTPYAVYDKTVDSK